MIEEKQATLNTHDGTTIFTHAWHADRSDRLLVCVHGLGGHGGYYKELAEQLVPTGTNVISLDLRGHGHSAGARGDIDRFEHYLADLDATIIWGQTCWPDLPMFLFGESMGASIAIHYLALLEQRATIHGLVLISPVLRSAIRPTLQEAAHYIRFLLTAPSRPSMPTTGREELGCRDDTFNSQLRADPLFVRLVSVRFLNRLSRWMWQTRQKAAQIALPLLVLQGEQDHVAHLKSTLTFLHHTGSTDQKIVTLPTAYHSLLHDPVTPLVMKTLIVWLAARSETP